MNRRELFGLVKKVGIVAAATMVPWKLLESYGVIEEYYAEAAAFSKNYLVNNGTVAADTSTGTAGIAAHAINSGDAVWAVTEVTDEQYLWPKEPAKPTKGIKVQVTQAPTGSASYRLEWTVSIVPDTTHSITLLSRGENLGASGQIGEVRLGETSGFAKYYLWNAPYSFSAGYESKWFPRTLLMASPSSTSGTPVSANTHVRLRVILGAAAGTTPTYYIGSIRHNTLAKPNVTISLDDVPARDYTNAFPYMQARGLVGSCAVDTAGTNMTVAQMLEMQRAGWSMHNHTATHANLTSLTAAQMRTEIETCRAYLIANGLNSGPSVMILPFGARNATVDSVVSEYYPYTMLAAGETNGFPIWPGIMYPNQVDRVSMDAPTSSSTIIGYINNAVARGNSINLYGHDVQSSAANGFTDLASFQTITEHICRLVQGGVVNNPNLENLFVGMTNRIRRRRSVI